MRILWREAMPIAATLAAVAVVAGLWRPWLALAPGVLSALTLWFFRDPERQAPPDPDALVSPADGRVIRVDAGRVSIFLSVFNVHVCRAPLAGRVSSIAHTTGGFRPAFRDGASERNERATLAIEGEHHSVRFTLVAGLVARRIVTWVKKGQRLNAGERVGLIRFGSRVDVDLPVGTKPSVARGDRVTAGETIVARLPATRAEWAERGNSGIVRDGQETTKAR